MVGAGSQLVSQHKLLITSQKVLCFLCVDFSICLHLGNIEVGDIVQLHRTLGSPHNLAIVMFFCIKTRADDHFKLLFKKLCIVSY